MEADAQHDFVTNKVDELPFKRSSLLKILCVEDDSNWYLAELDGRTGLVPCNYISMRPHDWYERQCSRQRAEDMLLEVDEVNGKYLQPDGAFILRQSEASNATKACNPAGKGFSLSVKENNKVSHFKIIQEGHQYYIWLLKFNSINELINHHRNTSISRNGDLLLIDRVPSKKYVKSQPTERVIAVCDLSVAEPNKLSFKRGDVIIVLRKENAFWWYGRMTGGSNQLGLFPANYVHPLPPSA